MIAEGTDAGVFHEAERELLEGVIRFADRPLRNVMVPRHAITGPDVDDPLDADPRRGARGSGHSRFPLSEGDVDNVHRLHPRQGPAGSSRCSGGRDLRAIAREPLYVGETIPALRMIDLFRSCGHRHRDRPRRVRRLEGLVTPTDILTAIAGDLPEPAKPTTPTRSSARTAPGCSTSPSRRRYGARPRGSRA